MVMIPRGVGIVVMVGIVAQSGIPVYGRICRLQQRLERDGQSRNTSTAIFASTVIAGMNTEKISVRSMPVL